MSATQIVACPRCTTAVEPGAKFCPNCGAFVSGIFSGGGSPLDGTAVLAPDRVDTVFPLLRQATLGDYDIYGELGRGGMAAVYLALDLALNRKVAIKTMLPDLVSREGMVQRFRREAQTAAALSHPHIIQIYSVKQTDSLVYFVMKYIEGRSLESVLVERGAVDFELTRAILAQTGSALAFAHRKGVVHRDVKPANIMLEEDGWAIVTDFGIAKVQEAQALTGTGTAIGTPHYMSPEQFHNKNVTGLSDQYSLGVVAYEMLTGKKPYEGETYAEILTQHLFDEPPDIRKVRPELPQAVSDAVRRMMAKDPAERFPDLDVAVAAFGAPDPSEAGIVRTQIISLAKSGPQRQVRMSVPISPIPIGNGTAAAQRAAQAAASQPSTAPARRAWRWSVVAVVCALLLGGGGWWMYGTRPKPLTQAPPAPVQQSGTPAPDSQRTTAGVADSLAAPDSTPVVATAPPPVRRAAKGTPSSPAARHVAAVTKGDVTHPKGAGDSTTARRRIASDAAGSSGSRDTQKQAAPSGAEALPAPRSDTPPATRPETPAKPGTIKVASRTPGAELIINGISQGAISSPRVVSVAAGTAHVVIRSSSCPEGHQEWDTTVVVRSDSMTLVGYRGPCE